MPDPSPRGTSRNAYPECARFRDRTEPWSSASRATLRPRTPPAEARSASSWVHRLEGERERMNLVTAPELRPRTIATGLRHQAFERHIRTAAQSFEIGSGRDQKLRRASIVIRHRQNIQRMRVDIVHHVFAHDQRVTECAKISLQIGD